jgi:hypothetical protein
MRPIEQLNNVEKAHLLHQLFPAEIPAFLKFVKGMCATLKEQEAADREHWQNGLFTFDFWMQLVNQAETILLKYGNQLEKNSRLFSDQLFDGYLAMYLAYCLSIYTTQQVLPNEKFSKMTDLLFNP